MPHVGWFKLPHVGDWLFTERRLGACALGWILGYAILLAQGPFPENKWLRCRDFGRIWLSGGFAVSSDPVRVYDFDAFSAAQFSLFGPGTCVLFYHFPYPPTFLFFTYPLGLMPYSIAFVVWVTVTLVLYLAAVYAILPRPAAMFVAVTSYAAFWNVVLGQNGFLTAGLIGLSLAFMERRPWLSGVFLGLLTYKPHFGILFPLALLASRNWRGLLSATIVGVAFAAAATIAFGYQTWPSFIDTLADRQWNLGEVSAQPVFLISVLGFLASAGINANISWAAQFAIAAFVALTVCIVWAKPIPHALKAATLCIGAVTVTPYVLGYDFCILSIAVAFIVKDGLSRGFLRGERTCMLLCWFGLILPTGPIPALISATLLVLVLRRVVVLGEATAASPAEAVLGAR
jgi:arabinofuranan 3-O-arabinosyltransferase